MKLPRCNGPLPRVRCAGVSKRPALVSRSSSPFDCHHPCRSSSFPSRFSYLAQLVRVGLGTVRCKVQYGQCTRCGALFQSQPRSSRGPRYVSERRVSPADFLEESSTRHAMLALSFLLGTRAADAHASRTSWPCVGDLRSGLSSLFGLHGRLFFPSLSNSEWATVRSESSPTDTSDVR